MIIKLLKSLRKATGLGIADCKKVINKYNDLGLAIKYALNLMKKPSLILKMVIGMKLYSY